MITSKFTWMAISIQLFTGIFQSCSFTEKTTKQLYNDSKEKTYDVVVVPGVPFENGQWSRTMKARVYWSKFLFDRGIAKNIMYSGSSVYSPYYEAEIMSLYAQAIGIPRHNILTEIKAEHSTENIYYSYRKAKLLGFDNIALASDPFQTKLLRRYTRKKVSPDVKLIPMVIDSVRMMESQMADPIIDPRNAINKDFIPITERENFWKRWRGTRGQNVDTTAYKNQD